MLLHEVSSVILFRQPKLKIFCLTGLGLAVLSAVVLSAGGPDPASELKVPLAEGKTGRIEKYVRAQMKSGKIPGLAIVVVNGNQVVYQKGFGVADLRTKRPVTSGTLFELGSNSEALTALGILRLQAGGLLNINDPVSKYLPWFNMKYIRKEERNPTIDNLNKYKYIPWFKVREDGAIKLNHLLRHTSGIPSHTIVHFPVARDGRALEKTVRRIVNEDLVAPPGEKFEYAAINYDILGLIIQEVTGEKYEVFMKENLLEPLGLKNTFLFRKEAAGYDLATGYKIGFLQPHALTAPVYRGNTPAGYIITNSEDLARWLMIQLDTVELPPLYQTITGLSHGDNYPYTYGWNLVRTSGGEMIWRGGNNPNFSSYIELRPGRKLGVAVLSNLNTSFSLDIGCGIMSILLEKGRLPEDTFDLMKTIDSISVFVFCFLLLGLTVSLSALRTRFKKYNQFAGITKNNRVAFLSWWLALALESAAVYAIPEIFDYSWNYILVWVPLSFTVVLCMVLAEGLLGMMYLLNVFFFTDKKYHHAFKRI
jgi:putative pyoverdin transport system ATP-binding/permease protein